MSNTVPTNSDVRSVATDESSVDELFDVLTTERRRRVVSIMGATIPQSLSSGWHRTSPPRRRTSP